MKKNMLKRKYVIPQCFILNEDFPSLLTGSVRMEVGGNNNEEYEEEQVETSW